MKRALLVVTSLFLACGSDDRKGFEQNGAPGNAQLDALIPGGATEDASVLTIVFTPTGNQIQFSYVFASEEYNEFVGSIFNDVFAFFVGNSNYARLPGTNTPCGGNRSPPSTVV